jgi:glycerate-2-kinase
MHKSTQDELTEIFNAALAAVDPYHAVLNALRLENNCLLIGAASYALSGYQRIVVVGAGKASARMALAIEHVLGARINKGLIIVKDGHSAALQSIRQIEASHPLPNQAGASGTQEILQLVQQADARTLLICLISGGASALLVAPAAGLTLADKQAVSRLLLNAGASVDELNAVRKHLSAVKGGRLAQAAYPAQMLTLVLSDVIGDRLDVIASGPTSADETRYEDAWAVLEKYRLLDKLPASVALHLQQGIAGNIGETIKPGDACLSKTHNVIVGGLGVALQAAREKSLQLEMPADIITAELQGEARSAAHYLAQTGLARLQQLQAGARCILLSGGETTVTVHGNGLGGRNQELALAFALEIEGQAGITLLSAGTDGSDGPNDAAGAIVHGDIVMQAARLNIDAAQYLASNDSYHFFQAFDLRSGGHSHLITGPTGTNVMDMQIMLLQK